MNKLLGLKPKAATGVYLLMDIVCVGAGMGVPVFCILLGFPLGWCITQRTVRSAGERSIHMSKILRSSLWASAFTFLLMLVIWGTQALKLVNPGFDVENFGHPFFLYDPMLSFIGWLVLMIFVSPFLQLLATIFASFLTLSRMKKPDTRA